MEKVFENNEIAVYKRIDKYNTTYIIVNRHETNISVTHTSLEDFERFDIPRYGIKEK